MIHKAGMSFRNHQSLPEKRTNEERIFDMPAQCRHAAARLRLEGEAAHRCQNISCPSRQREAIIHFVSRDAMNIEGLGPAVISQLLENHLIEDAADLYYLEYAKLIALERMGDKSAQNLLNSIEASKERGLAPLDFCFGYPAVGVKCREGLANRYGTMEPCGMLRRKNSTQSAISGLSWLKVLSISFRMRRILNF
jgi:DNA ligase (NAD+)